MATDGTAYGSVADFRAIFDALLDAVFLVDTSGRILDANATAEHWYGYTREELQRLHVSDLAASFLQGEVAPRLQEILESPCRFEWVHVGKDGSPREVEIVSRTILWEGRQAILSCVRDIRARKALEAELRLRTSILEETEARLQDKRRILEMMATQAPLARILEALVTFIEERVPEVWGSILLLDPDGLHVRHGAAPRLPVAFCDAIEGQPIGPAAGSCGTAAWRKAPVLAADIATDPLWTDYRDLALCHGLRACWSTPILDEQDLVLGTFALYTAGHPFPEARLQPLLEDVTHLAAIAIANHRQTAQLTQREAQLAMIHDNVHDILFVLAVEPEEHYRFQSVNHRFLEATGLREDQVVGREVTDVIPEPSCTLVRERYREAIRTGTSVQWNEVTAYPAGERTGEVSVTPVFREGACRWLVGAVHDITALTQATAKIQRMSRLYAALSQCNQAIVRCSDAETLFPVICRDAVNFGGMKMAWVGMVGEDGVSVTPVASYGTGTDYLEGLSISSDGTNAAGRGPTGTAIRENRPVWCQDFQNDPTTAPWHARGQAYGWGASASLPLHRNGQVVGAFTLYSGEPQAFDAPAQDLLQEMALDISFALARFVLERERREALSALENSERQLRTIIDTEPECVKIIDAAGRLQLMNAAGLAMLEVESLEALQAGTLLDFVVPEYREAFRAVHQRVMQGEQASLEFEIQGRRGTRRWVETHAASLPLPGAGGVALLGITRDISGRKQSEDRIRYLANFDALTGLPNRYQLDTHLNFALNLARRSNGTFAVMFLDLDRFKDVNDSLGHRLGDALLVEVANRLREVLRAEDTVSRLGGDEFILMFPGCDMRGAAQVAQKLLDAVSRTYRIAPYDLTVSASIGIALYPEDGEDLDALFRNADTAMYRAKRFGRNRFSFYTSEMQSQAARTLQLVSALRQAIAQDGLAVFYQPQFSLADGRLVGAEALLRWHHPALGDVSPAEFIPAAEDCGLILPLGEWVLRQALAQWTQWRALGHDPFSLSVNFSGVQFRQAGLPEWLGRLLAESGAEARWLELELTESVMMGDPEGEITMIGQLHALGVRVAIDDFGTGYSSLNYLKRFKVSRLKIDQSFVRDIDTDQEDRAIVSAIISMARSLGLATIAEGVETPGQRDFLRGQGCDEAQGYLYSPPLTTDAFTALLDRLR